MQWLMGGQGEGLWERFAGRREVLSPTLPRIATHGHNKKQSGSGQFELF